MKVSPEWLLPYRTTASAHENYVGSRRLRPAITSRMPFAGALECLPKQPYSLRRQMLVRLLRRAVGLDSLVQGQRQIQREVAALISASGDGSLSVKFDNVTPRIAAFRKHDTSPLISPSGASWMAGAVYDARPVDFGGRKLFYFCAQPVYRSDMLLVIGLAELVDGKIKIYPEPVLVPDVEASGIDVPAFTVFKDQVVGIYFDGHGLGASGRGVDGDVVVVRSKDGTSFSKHVIKTPMRGLPSDRVGAPWLLNDDGTLRVYMRAKTGSRTYLVSAVLDLDSYAITQIQTLCDFPRNPITISVSKRSCGYLLFYGCSSGGGFYVGISKDGLKWDLSQEKMLTSPDSEWGWDYYKVCASPDNSQDDVVSMCYTSNNSRLCIGFGHFHVSDLSSASIPTRT